MGTNEEMIYDAVEIYGMDPKSLVVHEELPKNSHGDLHFKIQLENKCYSARFIGSERYDHDVFGELTDDVLLEQMKYCDFLNAKGIPFMRRKPPADGNKFIHFTWKGFAYRFLLFEWIEGKHITRCTEDTAYKFGEMVRQYHNVSCTYSASLPKISHLEGYKKFITMIRNAIDLTFISTEDKSMLQTYLWLSEHHIEHSFSSTFEFIMQSDLNPLNILWDETDSITGIIDFEHIGYTDRIEGIAWLIKWYSRIQGIGNDEVSPRLTQSLLKGYGTEEFLNKNNLVRLQSLIWLTGCMNWGFVAKTLDILMERNGRNQTQLKEHLMMYQERGEKLLSLVLQPNLP